MASTPNFGKFFDAQITLGTQILSLEHQVSKAIFDGERWNCWLESSDIFFDPKSKAHHELTPSKEVGVALYLAWVGKDKCLSGHSNQPSFLWNLAEQRECAVLDSKDREENESDCAAAATTDGRVVIGSDIGYLRLWNLEPLQLIAIVPAHDSSVLSICLAGDRCITGGGNLVNVWETSTLRGLAMLEGHTNNVTCLALARKNQCLSGSEDGTVRIWDIGKYQEVACYKGHKGRVCFVSEIGGGLCASYERISEKNQISGKTRISGEIRVWRLEDRLDIYQISPVCGLHFEIQNDVLYCSTGEKLKIYNLQTQMDVATVDFKTKILYVHYFNGKCTCVGKKCVYEVEVDKYEQVHTLSGHTAAVKAAIPFDSGKLVSWSDGELRVWDVTTYRELTPLEGLFDKPNCAALTSDGRCITGDQEGHLEVWDLVKMREIQTELFHTQPIMTIAVTNNGKAIVADSIGDASVWNLANYTRLGELKGHRKPITCIVLISDDVAITGSEDTTIKVWKVTECKCLATLDGHEGAISDMALASGNRCISASKDTNLKVWDLQKYALLDSLHGHKDFVEAVAVAGERCVSGSDDKQIFVWDLRTYMEEARFECKSPVSRIVFISESLFASGHGNGEVKVWDGCREVASIKRHSTKISSLKQLDSHRVVTTADGDETVKVLDLGQLSDCLSLCSDHATLESEVAEHKRIPYNYRQRLKDFKSGKVVLQPEAQMLVRPYFFNALHTCAYYSYPERLKEYLDEGVPLVRGIFGSPLTLALERKTIQCVNVVLDYLTQIAPKEDAWKSFETINDDLLPLIECGSSRLKAFFSVLLQHPSQRLPTFITPVVPLPLTKFLTQPYIEEVEVFANVQETFGEELVEFAMSLIYWNFSAGSQQSVDLLTAAVGCEDKHILLTDFFRTIIEQKWANFFPFVLFVATAYATSLMCLMLIISVNSEPWHIAYLSINGLFGLYEFVQIIVTRSDYFTEWWNIVDLTRCTLGISWASLRLTGFEVGKHFTLVIVLLDFMRGFTHFRAFRMTRIFVFLTFAVVAEVYSFLVILAYSVFAFGVFTAVLVEETSLGETWKKAYSMAMGNFETNAYSSLEWVVFTGATVTNVVIMMNLLISILGEAYEKAQTTILENDLLMQANLVLEYESLMTWRRNSGSKMWIMTCRNAQGEEQQEWTEEVLQTTKSLTSGLSKVEKEITEKLTVTLNENAEEIRNLKTKIESIEGKLDTILCYFPPRR